MRMLGEEIIARSISCAQVEDRFGNSWQYHSRSDRHSRVSCWAVMFDLLRRCPLLQSHVLARKVGFGINHEMRDFRQDRKKNLDLVLCLAGDGEAKTCSFADYGRSIDVVLTGEEERELAALPSMRTASVSNVLVAVEAKACMTEHTKAQSRLYAELDSSYQTIHGDTNRAIAAAYVMINCADDFVSPGRNLRRIRRRGFVVNRHAQPAAAAGMLGKIMKLPRRSDERDHGFDAMGITMIRCRNDGSPVVLDPAGNDGVPEIVGYAAFIERLAHLYATKFLGL